MPITPHKKKQKHAKRRFLLKLKVVREKQDNMKKRNFKEEDYFSLPPTRQVLTQGQKLERQLKWG